MKRFCILLSILMAFISASAQNLHLNTFIGLSNYYGDLQSKRYTFNQSHFAWGIGLSYEVSDNFSLKAMFTSGKVSADDKLNPQTEARNLNFTSSISEFQLTGEYDLRNLYDYNFSPYIFAGLAVYHFNPYTRDTLGAKYYLQPLSTEGQGFFDNRKPYNLTQLAIPFGGGFKFALSDNVRIGIEAGFRKLFTDYLDDVSTTYVDPNLILVNRGPKAEELAYRGNELKNGNASPPVGDIRGGAKYKDWYYFTGVNVSFRLGGGGGNKSLIGKSKIGCPVKVY